MREILEEKLRGLGLANTTDAKGNLNLRLSKSEFPPILVTAHMDEIAMIVRRIELDGRVVVAPLGGLFAWKLGEGPVRILSRSPVDGVLCFGSIHTADPGATVRKVENAGLDWEMARVFTGLTREELEERGVRPGTRVVVAAGRRWLNNIGDFVAGYFLDDRADLVSWLLALEELKGTTVDVQFSATAAEEVGGEGALYIMQELRPEVCIALELAPRVPDAPIKLNDQPVVWVNDSYSAMAADDIDLIADIGERLGMDLQFQALSRGGSDASCAASHGHCARPFTLGLPMENSHGYEIMHPGAMINLARLTVELIRDLTGVNR